VAARSAGARGYLSKEMAAPEMIAAIRRFTAPGKRVTAFVRASETPGNTNRSTWLALLRLTTRETQVLNELREGRTNREIATRLGVSVTTINKHVQQVLKKLRVKTRGQAVARIYAESSMGAESTGRAALHA
jgi:two-component system NarL family response regulator